MACPLRAPGPGQKPEVVGFQASEKPETLPLPSEEGTTSKGFRNFTRKQKIKNKK